ncbi:hypothetical protein GKC56_05545 [Neisseriaceae bacterium PsAf]|nr:hypothetical protein [Neisseriaceae bacterium PsAf]
MLPAAELNRTTDLTHAKELLRTQGYVAMYEYLETQGSRYSTLALGLTREPRSFAGEAALKHMQTVAKETQGRELSSAEIDNIMYNMAEGYLIALREKQIRRMDFTEVTADEAQAFHNATFVGKGLPKYCWTLSTPFESMDDLNTLTSDQKYREMKEDIWRESYYGAGNITLEKELSINFLARVNGLRSDFVMLSRSASDPKVYDSLCYSSNKIDHWIDIQNKNLSLMDTMGFVLNDGSGTQKLGRGAKGAWETYRDWENDHLDQCPKPNWDKSSSLYPQIEPGIPNNPAIQQRAAGIMMLLEQDENSLNRFTAKYNPIDSASIMTYAALKTIEKKENSIDNVFYAPEDDTLRVISGYKGFAVPAKEVSEQNIEEITQNHSIAMQNLMEQEIEIQRNQEQQILHERSRNLV